MGRNISDRKLYARAMAADLSEWKGWFLHVDRLGETCARGRHYDVASPAGAYPRATLGQCVDALRCRICAKSAERVRLTRPRRGFADEVFGLLGPGTVR